MAHRICAILALSLSTQALAQTENVYFTVNTDQQAQIILGLGFEIQSDSIGSGNHGLPTANTSVPNDLIPSEKERFFTDMLGGFRLCRLALGLYFRGLTHDQKNVVERWPGQAAGLAEMNSKAGLEGFAVEYWSPPPGWKSTANYIGGTLSGLDAATLSSFAAAVTADALYLKSMGMPVAWWALQNEPPVGPNGCIYSCCGYNATQYYLAFKAAASSIRSALPSVTIHASSWSGQYYSPPLVADPQALALVDAWTFHHIGADSNDCIQNQKYFLAGSQGRPVLSNEYEYLDDKTNEERTINTAQSIMNWFAFENSPTWFWLHALKPLTNAEAAGYGLGYWQPWNYSSASTPDRTGTGHSDSDGGKLPAHIRGDIPPGTWEYNPYNWNSLAGFTRYLPWNSVRVNVTEDVVRGDVRVLAYMFNQARARWRVGQVADLPTPVPGESRALLDASSPASVRARAEATSLGIVLTNRYNVTVVQAMVSLAGSASSSLSFTGHGYGPNITDAPLGTVSTVLNSTTGLQMFSVTLPPYSIQFWVQD